MERKEFERKLISAPVKEKLDMLKRCGSCPYTQNCFELPNSEICQRLLTGTKWKDLFCKNCGWRLADPDPCEGCRTGELFTTINHQNDNEI